MCILRHREARKAKANGSTRFCMGAAWRDMNGRKTNFKRILEMVKEIKWVCTCRLARKGLELVSTGR